VGYERIEESQNPEISIGRAMENYLKIGYSKEWINQRLKSIEVRKELTGEFNLILSFVITEFLKFSLILSLLFSI